jgi:hypothetical protein
VGIERASVKYKVGDRIRLTEAVSRFRDGPYYEAPPGTTGTIMEADGKGDLVYGVNLDDGLTVMGGYHEHELEKLEEEDG